MKSEEINVGIYRIKLTVYKTGNICVSYLNKISGEERTLKVRNPLIFHKEVGSINYRI